MVDTIDVKLPCLDCGLCGYRTCEEFRGLLIASPEMIRRCVHLSQSKVKQSPRLTTVSSPTACGPACGECPSTGCSSSASPTGAKVTASPARKAPEPQEEPTWRDSLGREFDFYLEHFPEEPGPREIIIPHNPMLTREMEIRKGDILIGRPLGMSCGCPITHCGVAMEVDARTGVIVWCVTGPLGPRKSGFKDLGYYIAEGYEGLVRQARCELKFGLRYYFQPQMCMLQWRHSGLVNYLNRNKDHYQIRVEGLWIG